MGISVTQLLIVLAIVVVLFGTKRLRNIGADLGGAIRGFRSSMQEGEASSKDVTDEANTIDGEVKSESKDNIK